MFAPMEPKPLDYEPLCVKCHGKMRFSCFEEEKPGFVHHVYECTNCGSSQSFVTPTNGSAASRTPRPRSRA